MNKPNLYKNILKILVGILIINLAIIGCTLYLFISHMQAKDDAATIQKINSIFTDMVVADKYPNHLEKLQEIKQYYEKRGFNIRFLKNRPKGTLIYTREGLIFDPNINNFVKRIQKKNNISISTFLHRANTWINIEAPRKLYLPQEETMLILFYGIPLPIISFILVGSLYTLIRRKVFIQALKTSLTNGDYEDDQENKEIQELRASVKRLIDQKILLQSSIAHDINTCIFRLRLKLAKYKTKDPTLTQELNYLGDIVKSSMILAKYEGSTIPLEHFDLIGLLEKFYEDFFKNADDVTFKLPKTFIPIQANAKLLNRVLHNLIDNAIKYATKVVITVKTQNNYVYLICKDNGKGIPENEIEQLLQPFEQKNKRNLGIGLGLAIINKIVQMQRGSFFLRNSKHGPGLLAIVRFKIMP